MNETHFLNRRSKLLDMMGEGVAIITSAPPQTRSNDTEYPYRQNSDFYYLCGLMKITLYWYWLKPLNLPK
jgi:Xaa-Pro aminopeptidase